MTDAAARERAHCPCGHVLSMCHRENAARWCPPDERLAAEQERTRRLEEALRETDRALRLERGGGTPLKPLEYIALANHNRTALDSAEPRPCGACMEEGIVEGYRCAACGGTGYERKEES